MNALTHSLARLRTFAWVLVSFPFALMAQPAAMPTSTPTAEQMVEQLKAAPLGRTRSFRNLVVEQAGSAPPTPEPRPSLSLLIQFEFDSAKVKPASQDALQNLARALQSPELVKSKFAVEGHTDAKGAVLHNQRLSEARAHAVRAFLTARQIEGDRLLASGKGSTELANPADPTAAENRRVRIVNLD